MDILWPRCVARIGVTRSTQACFLAADRQCTELPLLRLPRLVPEVVGCDPFVPRPPRPSAGGLEGARCKRKGGVSSRSPQTTRSPPRSSPSGRVSGLASQIRFRACAGSGARGIPRVARPAIRGVAAMRGKERGPRGTPPSGPLRGARGEGNCRVPSGASLRPSATSTPGALGVQSLTSHPGPGS